MLDGAPDVSGERRAVRVALALALLAGVVAVALPLAASAGWRASPAAARRVATGALWVGVLLPQAIFLVAQARPGGRRALPLSDRSAGDGWLRVLLTTFVAAMAPPLLASGAMVARPAHLVATIMSALLVVVRAWQLRAGGAAHGDPATAPRGTS